MVNKVLIIIFILSAMVFSQTTSYIEILKSDVNTQRRALITAAMEFTEEEAQKFWPIYKEYEIEYDKLIDKEINLIKDYAESYENMGEEVAHQLAKTSYEIEKEQLALSEKYFKKFSKEIEIRRTVKLQMILNRIELMINLQKASTIPVLE
ncbi:MAG: hypothetical protein KAV45_03915 [Calditrichia bacterium]|nr:hypothetical protein [Calditrichia bacterium]